MDFDTLLEELSFVLFDILKIECPYMSGNMNEHIEITNVGKDEATICVSAPAYDIKLWNEEKQIRYIGGEDYALDVNNYGGFFTHNYSMHWINRALDKACNIVAKENNGEVINNVGL